MVASISPSFSRHASADRTARNARAKLSRQEAAHDTGLVQRFNRGDQTAFAEIVSRYRTRMHHIALGMLRNQADAEEIAQDTFIRAHRGLATFRGESSLAAWLHRITLNLSRNRYWYFHRRNRHLTQSLDSTVRADSATTCADLLSSQAPGPVQNATMREFSLLVAASTAELNPAQREILFLRNIQQHSYREIARLLGTTVGTVKSRVARAREALRTRLVEAYVSEHTPATLGPAGWFEPPQSTGLLVPAGVF